MAVVRKKTKKKIVRQPELYFSRKDMELLERMARVEVEIKNINKNIEMLIQQNDKRFEQVDKRFEEILHYMDKRFEQVDKRFEQLDNKFNKIFIWIGLGFTMTTVLISVYKFIK